jgi:phytoene synthase
VSAYDLQACTALMRGGSKSFFAASRLLPQRMRSASVALYAFCRVADDVVDDGESPELGLQELQHRLNKIYQGQPLANLEDQALALVVHQHQLPRALLDALLDGFAWDAQGRHYETMADTHAYGARVAGTVGAMICWIMGVRHPQALARACELGVAMQLTNICRDVGEDALRGRIYLPLDEQQRFGVKAQDLIQRTYSDNFTALMKFQTERAHALYDEALALLPAADRRAQKPGLMMASIYRTLLREIEASGFQVLHQRIALTPLRKLWLAWKMQALGRF